MREETAGHPKVLKDLGEFRGIFEHLVKAARLIKKSLHQRHLQGTPLCDLIPSGLVDLSEASILKSAPYHTFLATAGYPTYFHPDVWKSIDPEKAAKIIKGVHPASKQAKSKGQNKRKETVPQQDSSAASKKGKSTGQNKREETVPQQDNGKSVGPNQREHTVPQQDSSAASKKVGPNQRLQTIPPQDPSAVQSNGTHQAPHIDVKMKAGLNFLMALGVTQMVCFYLHSFCAVMQVSMLGAFYDEARDDWETKWSAKHKEYVGGGISDDQLFDSVWEYFVTRRLLELGLDKCLFEFVLVEIAAGYALVMDNFCIHAGCGATEIMYRLHLYLNQTADRPLYGTKFQHETVDLRMDNIYFPLVKFFKANYEKQFNFYNMEAQPEGAKA